MKSRGWKIADLERASGVKRRTIERLRSGERDPQPGTIDRLAAGFGIKPRTVVGEWLLGLSKAMPLPPPLENDAPAPQPDATPAEETDRVLIVGKLLGEMSDEERRRTLGMAMAAVKRSQGHGRKREGGK